MTSPDLATRVAEVLQELLGIGHPTAATTLHDLAVTCAARGEEDKAQSLWAAARSVLAQGETL